MKLTLTLMVDNATGQDVTAFTFLLKHLTHQEDAMERLLKRSTFGFTSIEPGLDDQGRADFTTGRAVTVKAARKGTHHE